MVSCPICSKSVREKDINGHLDSGCAAFVDAGPPRAAPVAVSSFFHSPAAKRTATPRPETTPTPTPAAAPVHRGGVAGNLSSPVARKRSLDDDGGGDVRDTSAARDAPSSPPETGPHKKAKLSAVQRAAPLADRMRPRTLDDMCGQELVGPRGVLRALVEQDRVPSMILWGGAGTGKTTIGRCVASTVGGRFVEINSTSTGVAECKKIFADARGELTLTGRKTIVFCDEIHRFSKTQQDVFLGPVETGLITLIGATTENPSFKVQNALMSRCRVFTLQKLAAADIRTILERALAAETAETAAAEDDDGDDDNDDRGDGDGDGATARGPPSLVDDDLLGFLATFADGDARVALNLLELALDLAPRPGITAAELKRALTHTLVYDRAGDQHYDAISAFHKSVRGSAPDAALYYLARMLQSGEDPLYVARRMVVIASEDVGLADNSLLPLATAAYAAAERLGMPECRIALAHCAVALCLAPKSTRAYRGLGRAVAALAEPGVAALPIPPHLRNAPTRLMRELGHGAAYKYNPDYKDGRVAQEYLPDGLRGRVFLDGLDLGTEIDPDAWP